MDTRRSVFVIVSAVILLVSLVGTASALNQTWYMLNTGSGATGADYEMQKDGGEGTTLYVEIDKDVSKIWAADQAVAVDGGIDMNAVWTGNIRLYVTQYGTHSASLQVDIGVLSSVGGFTLKDSNSDSWDTTGIKNMPLSFTLDDLALAKDEYLALKLTNTHGTNWVRIHTADGGDKSPSYITYPLNNPDYPVPELSTLLLTSVGMLMLGGFVVYSRRRNNK